MYVYAYIWRLANFLWLAQGLVRFPPPPAQARPLCRSSGAQGMRTRTGPCADSCLAHKVELVHMRLVMRTVFLKALQYMASALHV